MRSGDQEGNVQDVSDEVIIEEVDENSDTRSVIELGAATENLPPINSYAVSLYQSQQNAPVMRAFQQPVRDSDDSSNAFGDQFAKSIGSVEYAPEMPQPSAPDITDAELEQMKQEYEAWLRTMSVTERQQFERNQEWQENLEQTGYSPDFEPCLTADEFPADDISQQFKQRVLEATRQTPAELSFLQGVKPPVNFNRMDIFFPEGFNDIDPSNLQRQIESGTEFDAVNQMISKSNAERASSWLNLASNVIEPNRIWVMSNHNGLSHGHRYEIWGPGARPSTLTTKEGSKINKVDGTETFELNTHYAHVPGRFTIIRINRNEVGFCYDRLAGKIQKILPGRYFIRELNHNYIGKAKLQANVIAEVQVHAQNTQSNIHEIAQQLQVCQLTSGYLAFVADVTGTFVVDQVGTYVIDQRENRHFINVTNTTARKSRASDETYHIVKLQPGEYIVFRDNKANSILWNYDASQPENNTLHLSAAYYQFDGAVHSIIAGSQTLEDMAILINRPDQFAVVQDAERQVRFYEEANHEPLVLRAPFRLLDQKAKSEKSYVYNENSGSEVVRLRLNASEWAVTLTAGGQVKLLPPLLNNQNYYLYQPNFTLAKVVSRNQEGVQRVDLEGFGAVNIVNLASGEIGSCRIQNLNFFLNPRPFLPYVFVAPDVYFDTIPKDEAHASVGDLHRVYLQPGERACVVVDGVAHVLPSDSDALAQENKGDGIYIFRARQQFTLHGPVPKTQKQYQLGPYMYFTVEAGEVAHGTQNGALKIWHEMGEHVINTSKGERFNGFFATNVEPIDIKRFPVVCKHSIGSTLDLCVTYSLTDPVVAITRHHGSHDKLNSFIGEIARSVMFDLCAKKPPLGFSDSDFDSHADLAAPLVRAKGEEDPEATNLDEVRGEFETKLRNHPEIQRAGIEIGFANITAWHVEPEFLKAQQDNAKSLMATHTENLQQQLLLDRQSIENKRQEERNCRALLIAEGEKANAVLKAQQEAEVQAAQAKAKAEAEVVQQEAELKKSELASQQEKLRASASAETKAAAETAEAVAKARAEQQVAEQKLATAKTLLQARDTEAQADIKSAEAAAKKTELDVIAKFPGLDPDKRAQYMVFLKLLEVQKSVAENTKTVTHTLDPAKAEQAYERQMQLLWGMAQGMVPDISATMPQAANSSFLLLNRNPQAASTSDTQSETQQNTA